MVELGKNAGSRPLTKITGLAAVYQMEPMENINQIVMITGKSRIVSRPVCSIGSNHFSCLQ